MGGCVDGTIIGESTTLEVELKKDTLVDIYTTKNRCMLYIFDGEGNNQCGVQFYANWNPICCHPNETSGNKEPWGFLLPLCKGVKVSAKFMPYSDVTKSTFTFTMTEYALR